MPPAAAPEQLTLDDGEPAGAPRVELRRGDMLDVLPTLRAESVHAVVTDPPYGLLFMGRAWDHAVPVDVWTECLRVLKPGGHLLAFGGTRTSHRLACAIEDAGFGSKQDELARRFGVAPSSISDIRCGRSWAHVA